MHRFDGNPRVSGFNNIVQDVGTRPHRANGIGHGESALRNSDQLRKFSVAQTPLLTETFQINRVARHDTALCPEQTLVNSNLYGDVAKADVDGVSFCGTVQPMQNRIRELRLARGWSMRQLADRLNTTGSTVNKLEKDRISLDVRWMMRLAEVFEVAPADIMDSGEEVKMAGFRQDAEPYTVNARDEPPDIRLTATQSLYESKTSVLDQLGILPGVLLVIDMSKAALLDLRSEDIVLCQLYREKAAITLLRQFIHPSLLITNSSEQNEPTLNLRTSDVAIKGVLISSHAQRRVKDARR